LDLNSGIKIHNFFYQLKDYSKQGDSTGDSLYFLEFARDVEFARDAQFFAV
jgi:hypothetical protein